MERQKSQGQENGRQNTTQKTAELKMGEKS